jgi:uncharacterized membrane protein
LIKYKKIIVKTGEKTMKKLLLVLLASLILLSSYGFCDSEDDEVFEENYIVTMETAKVIEASEIVTMELFEGYEEKYQDVVLEVLSGSFKGEKFGVINPIPDSDVYAIKVNQGDKVVVNINDYGDGEPELFITDHMRQHYIMYLLAAFLILLVLVGKGKGVKAVITLGLTIFAIFKILLPAILSGYNPIPITIGVSIAITIVTMLIIGGFNAKSVSGIIGTSGGVIIAGLIAYYIGSKVKLTGLSGEEAVMLMNIPQAVNFDFKSLLFSGIIMGALGAVMDVGMSISSAMEEIHIANPKLSRLELFSAGMNIGKDVMGTMTNTLILAYAGSSIPLLLLFMAYETSFIKIMNLDIIATEIVRSLAGSIGLVMTIPLTAFVASVLLERRKNKSNDALVEIKKVV